MVPLSRFEHFLQRLVVARCWVLGHCLDCIAMATWYKPECPTIPQSTSSGWSCQRRGCFFTTIRSWDW